MTINEFLNELKLALEGEIPGSEIASNLRYYESYMKEQRGRKTEEEITAALGDPRLIARTIINTFQMNHGNEKNYTYDYNSEGSYNTDSSSSYQDYGSEMNRNRDHGNTRSGRNSGFRVFHMPGWLLTIIAVFILMVIFSLVFWIGGIVLKLLLKFGLPILLVLIGITYLRDRLR